MKPLTDVIPLKLRAGKPRLIQLPVGSLQTRESMTLAKRAKRFQPKAQEKAAAMKHVEPCARGV